MGIYKKIKKELNRARKLHPEYWNMNGDDFNLFERVGIMATEAGEALKEAERYTFRCADAHTRNNIKTELIQTAAVCVRILKWMEDDER